MSHITRDINRVTGTVIGISGKLILYALVILLLAEGITRGYAFGHSLFYESSVEQARAVILWLRYRTASQILTPSTN